MSDFPRTILPRAVTELELPGPLISKSQSGRISLRSTGQVGRTWRETFRLNMQLTAHKSFLAYVRNVWRNGTSFDISHIDYLVPKGTIGGSPLVQGATQLVSLPETFSGWTLDNTPVLTAGQTDPLGGTAAYLLSDDAAGTVESIYLPVTFTADGEKCYSIFLRQGSSAGNWLRVWDNSAGVVQRHRVNVTWTAGVPSLATGAGSGALYTPESYGSGWYRIAISAAGVVAANNNFVQVGSTDFTAASTGTVYIFGANAWNETTPARYAGPSQAAGVLGSTLYLNGATASVSNWIRAGDLLSAVVGSGIGVWEATADTASQANGYVPVPINPPIYADGGPADNAAVTVTGVKMRACLLEPPVWPESSGDGNNYGDMDLHFAETLE